MYIKRNTIDIDNTAIIDNLNRLVNQTYKLLPNREENIDWQTPLSTIIEEIAGMTHLLNHTLVFSLLCKLEGLYLLVKEEDFHLYRRTIFECLNLLQKIKEYIKCQE